ncbi:type IV secretion system protein [Methanolobus psychrophilus R15]|nr:type IV secretion system protein [Methanolobus psychrophilus R15]
MAGINTETYSDNEIPSEEAELSFREPEVSYSESVAGEDVHVQEVSGYNGEGKKGKKGIFGFRGKQKKSEVHEPSVRPGKPAGKKRFGLSLRKKKDIPGSRAGSPEDVEEAAGRQECGEYGEGSVAVSMLDGADAPDSISDVPEEGSGKRRLFGLRGSRKKVKKAKKPAGKKKSGLGLRRKKSQPDDPLCLPEDKNELSESEGDFVQVLLQKIEKIINPKPEVIDELVFEPGVVSKPLYGVPHKDLDLIYEVTPRFQYVHVWFDGEELSYECMEPPLSETEEQTMAIVQNAFDKMAHSEILLVEEENRKDALRDRFYFITEIYRFKLTESQKEKFFYYLHKKYMGFDRIDLLMNDPYIEDVTCNGPYSNLYVNHRMYGSLKTNVSFEELELNNFVMRMAQAAGRHISVLQPIRDATLTDGSRANLTLGKEVTKRGSTFTIRRFKSNPVSCIDLMNYGTYDARVLAYFWIVIEYKRSVLAAGGTASGKTTTLNALGSFIPPEYKIVSIEDTAEMNLMHPNWTQSITRAGFGGDSSSGKSAGDIELYDLLKAALRQRPEYIVVGEVRGSEAGTLFQAISVGHPCMGTIHAGSIQELLSRVESEPMNVPRNLFASVDMVIFNAMVKVGEHFIRRALRIVEIVELDPERKDLITNPVFKWDPVEDRYEFSGSSSLFEDIEEEFGIKVEELVREMDERAKYIESLSRQGICDYKDVARAIRKYARHKDELMETMQ